MEKILDYFKSLDLKQKWNDLQKDSPQIAKGLRIILFVFGGMLMLRGCNSCETQPEQTVAKPIKSEPIEQEVVEQEMVIEEPVKTSEEFSQEYTVANFISLNEQLTYLYKQESLSEYTPEQIREAYFKAELRWFKVFLLKKEDGEFVNLLKYLEDE